MSTYTLTPAERKARAQAIKTARENRLKYQEYLYNTKKLKEEYINSQSANEIERRRDIESQNFLVRGLSTVGDVVANVLTGAVKGLEGIVDLGIGLVGAVGGIFDGDFQDRVKDVIAYDWTGETFGNALQEALKYSYTTNGGIIESVASGIGQMLPAVVVSIATAGAGAPAAIAQAASLATLGVSAAGTSTEDAFQEGADYWAGLGYGVASGLVEVATEKMFGGATKALTGAGIFDGVTKSVADTGLKRIAKNVIEEGVEEMASEAVSPLLKAIYKGKDAFENYSFSEHLKEIGKAGLVGSLTALAYSGSVGYGLSKVGVGYVGKEADIADSMAEINALEETKTRYQANNKLTTLVEQKILSTQKANYQNIERVLQKVSEEKRAKYIEKFNLGNTFNADGSMGEKLLNRLNIMEQTEGGENSAQSELASPKKDYYSVNQRGEEQTIISDLKDISEDRAKAYLEEQKKEGKDITIEQAREHVGEFKVFSEETTEKASESFKKFKKGLNYLNKVSGGNVGFVVTEENKSFNGLLKDGKIYIGEDAFENDNWAGTLVHEYTHFAEGTEEYNQYVNFISSDENLLEKAESVVQKTYGFDTKKLDAILEKAKNGAEISEAEAKYFESYRTEVAAHQSEYLLGNEEFIDRLVLREANLAQKVIQKIQSLKKMFSKVDGKLTRAEHKRLIQAEKLYLKAASKAGNMQLVKMILAQNPDLAEEIDNSGEIRYNIKDKLVGKTFPPYNESFSEANELATRWAKQETIREGWQKLISFQDNWYLVEKFSDTDNGYQIVDKIRKGEYERYANAIKAFEGESYESSIDEGIRLYENGRAKQSIDSDETKNRRTNSDVSKMAQSGSSGESSGIETGRDNKQSGGNQQVKYTDNDTRSDIIGRLDGIKFSLKSADKYFYELTDGQVKKLLADKTKMKVYSKVEAEQVINTILDNSLGIGEKYGKLVGKSKAEVIEMLWRGLNTAEPGKQMHVALDIAEYIIQNSVLENLYEDSENDVYMDTISVLKPHLHSLDLSSIKGEIKYHYDTDNSPYLIWGKRKGDSGIAPDQLKPILEESGFYIDTDVGADIFFRIDEAYREAVNALKKKSKELLKSALSDDERKALKNKIAREVLLAFDENGKPSQFAKILDEYGKQAKFWKEKFYDEKIRGKARDSLFEAVDRVKGLEKYQRADVKLADEVLGLVKLLKQIKTTRGNISPSVRQIMIDYSKDVNGKKLYELLSNNTEGETNPFAKDIERIAHANGELSTQEIRALDAIVRNFIHNVNEYDRVFFEGRSQSETEVATTAINETRRVVKISDSGFKGLIRKYIDLSTNPINKFRRLGNYSNDSIIARIYAELQKGANKQSLFKQKVDALFDDFMKAHKKEIAVYDKQDIEIGGVKMSKGQMISLYLTFLRQQGRSHLFGEGDEGVIRLSNEKAKKQGLKESYNKGEDVKISRATIEEIQSKFTQTDKEFILLAQKFFNGEEYSKGAITETQEALYGVAMVEDDFYFPLRVADDQIYKEIGNDSLKDLFTVYSPSFTKAVREGANNKVVIENVLDVIKRHSNQMAAYYGLAQPIRTFNRLLNKNIDGVNWRSAILKADSSFIDYVNKLLGDLQGTRSRRGLVDSVANKVVGKIRSWGARAALGANPKVWVNQVVSLPAANAVGLNYKNLVKGFGKALTFKTDFESLFKYSPLAYERFRNGSNLDVGLLYEEKSFGGKLNKITDITTAPIQGFDKFTIGAIWNAALEQTKSKEYQDYSEDHYKKAAELTEKAITETQPNYTVLQRPEMLRSENEFIRLGTMFMTQPLQNLSLLASGIDKYLVSKKQLSLFAEGTEEYKKAKAQYEEAKKELWHKSSAVVVETTMLVLVAELFKMLLGKDDDKEFGERVLGDYLDSVIGMFPIIKDGYSIFQGYDISNMYYAGYTNIVNGINELYQNIDVIVSGKNYDQTTINSKVRKTLLGLSQTFGIPLRNIENYVKGIVGNISPATRLKYESNFTSQSTKVLTEKLKTAIDKGDDDLADTVVGIMLDEKGFGVEDSTVRKEIKTLTVNGYNVLPKGVGNSITYDGEEIVLTKGQAKAFKEIYSTANEALASLVKLSQYESATDEVKAKAINFIYNVYYNLALQDLLGEDLETKTVLFAEAIDVEKLAIIVATANSLKADVDKKGNVITGTRKKKIQTYINSLKLSAAQKYMIMGYLGFKNLKGETQVKAYINRLKLTKTEKEKLLQYSGYSK